MTTAAAMICDLQRSHALTSVETSLPRRRSASEYAPSTKPRSHERGDGPDSPTIEPQRHAFNEATLSRAWRLPYDGPAEEGGFPLQRSHALTSVETAWESAAL